MAGDDGRLILLTGPAAVGKSTVARALQKQLSRGGDLWLVLELDTFARGLSRNWIAVGERRGRFAERGFVYAETANGIQLTLGEDGRRVLAAFHRSVAAVVRSGASVIAETIVYDDADWRDWTSALADIRSCWVGLAAPVAVLEERERAEPTRAMKGLARGMSARAAVGTYDVEADTSLETVDAIVGRVVDLLRS
jgi:chloramphenicol 3-O-phosphotransferase